MKISRSVRFAQIGLVATTMAWGFTFTMVKSALEDAPPFAFSAWRFLMASALGFIFFNRRMRAVNSLEIFGGILCGFFLFTGYGFQNFGLVITSAGKSAFITSISIILVPVFLVLARLQKVHVKTWVSMLAAMLGLYFILDPRGSGINFGDVLTFGCAVSFAIHIILQDRYSKKEVDTFRFFVVQVFTVSILSFGNHFLFESQPVLWSSRLITALLITAVLSTLFGFIMMIHAQKILSPSRTAIIFSLEPLFAVLFAVIFTGEVFTAAGWVGGFMVIAGVIMTETGGD